jgi:NDP-sugar pyrophosphorylase family protein
LTNNEEDQFHIEVGIIAAGEGSRLQEEGIQIPKPLVNLNGIPLIQRIIDLAYKTGSGSVTCIINENSEELERFLTNQHSELPLNLIVKSTPSSFHSFYHVSRFLKTPFLLATADSVFKEEEFTAFLKYTLNRKDADVVVAVTNFIDDEKPLYANVNNDMRVKSFDDKNSDCEFVTGGLYLFKKDIQQEINEAVDKGISRLRNFLRFLVEKDYCFYAYPFSKIIDVDHISDIKKAEEFLMNK